jgi:hypothetical protein
MGSRIWRVVSGVAIIAVLFSMGTATGRAAQVSGNEYVSPTYGYSISWNAEFWTPTNESSEDGVDSLVLRIGEGVGNFFLTGLPASQQPADCVAAIASGRAESGDYPGYGQVSGRETPAVGANGAGALFGYTLVTQSGDEVPLLQYVECRTLIPGEALLLITLEVIDAEGLYEAALVLYADLISTLTLPGGSGQQEPAPDDEEEGQQQEEEPEQDDQQEEQDEDEPDSGGGDIASGVDGNVYTSPGFGYTVTWDPGLWEVTDESYEDGGEYFEVTTVSQTSIVSFIAVEGYGGDAAQCRDDANAILGDTEGITNFTPTPNVNTGEPLIGGDSALAFAIFDITYTDESGTLQARSYLQCRTLVAGRAVLALIWIVPTELFNSDLAAFESLLAGIDTSEAEVRPAQSSQPEEDDPSDEAEEGSGAGEEDDETDGGEGGAPEEPTDDDGAPTEVESDEGDDAGTDESTEDEDEPVIQPPDNEQDEDDEESESDEDGNHRHRDEIEG